ncbi:MAG: glycosyltransferase family 39 protein, partial [Bacteriovoracaceae bacterium]|nr:glycosyltransferase family 39 protein [Bacteriovoracaceae bacterium]
MNKDRLNLYVILLIGGLFLLNLFQSTLMNLSHDEAYYWIYSLFPAWGYYDHPPMVSWLIGLGSYFGDTETLVRLPFAILQAASLWLLWDLGQRKNFPVFASSVLCMPLILGSGFLALPDTPLMFFSILFWWLTLKYESNEKVWHVLLLSLVIACMFYSKYHSLVVVLLTVAAKPKLFLRKSFWAIVALVVVFYLPHVMWQADHDFITFDFHLNKRSEKHFELANILDFIGGQIALGGILAFLYGLFKVLKSPKNKLLAFNSIGFFIFVLLLSFRNRIEA